MSDKKQVGFRLPEEQHEKFEKELKKMGVTMSAMLQIMISDWLRDRGVE